MTAEPGQTLLHYRLVEKIGEGGMGVVWKAVDTERIATWDHESARARLWNLSDIWLLTPR